MKRLLILALAVATIASGCSSGSVGTPTPSPTSSHWFVQAGGSSQSEAVQGLAYYPKTITIDAGDAITWTFPAGEPHTVAFLGPKASPPPPTDPSVAQPAGGSTYDGTVYTSSGFVLGGKSYALTFTKAGTYKYYCLIHGEMVGTVVVAPPGTPYPQTQSDITDAAQTSLQADLAAATNALSLFPYAAGGAHVAAGLSPGLGAPPLGPSSVVRFLDGTTLQDTNVTVALGTTVVWTNLDSNLPHTVTFPVAGQQLPAMDPFSPPSGPSTYDGSTLTNSGPLFGGQSFSLTFTKAGTYTYDCLFHDDEGMTGTVTVQ